MWENKNNLIRFTLQPYKKDGMQVQKDKSVLFSPIGSTDPISNCRDGGMLHIARIYKPSKVILYFSDEMLAFEKTDHRYTRALSLLGEKLSHGFDVEVQKCADITEVHKFDLFYEEFEKRLKKISDENPESEILVNISSGTPAMKSALQFIAALGSVERLTAIQVATPEKKCNKHRAPAVNYDLETEWACDEDNETETFEDRSEVSGSLNLAARIKRETLIKHVEAYDYHAALSIAVGLGDKIPPLALKLLDAVAARAQLNLNRIQISLKETGVKIIPVESSDLRNIAEYLLWLDVKLKRGELADFIRGLTPLIADLFEYYISKVLKIDIRKYCDSSGEYSLKLKRYKLERTSEGMKILEMLDAQFNCYKDDYLSSKNMLCILKAFCVDKMAAELFENIRNVESAVRNIAAHEIIAITPELIEKKTRENGCASAPAGILNMLFKAAELYGIPQGKIKNSYGEMNELIKEALKG